MISGFRADVESLERVCGHTETHAHFIQALQANSYLLLFAHCCEQV